MITQDEIKRELLNNFRLINDTNIMKLYVYNLKSSSFQCINGSCIAQPGYPPAPGGPPQAQPVYPPPPAGPHGPQPPAPQVMHPTGTNTVVITNPTVLAQTFREVPINMQCPNCRNNIVTAVHYETGTLTWLACIILFLVG